MGSVKLNTGGQCIRFLFIAWNVLVLVSWPRLLQQVAFGEGGGSCLVREGGKTAE